jgi:arylsulfatase A-like enzyme
MTQPDIIFIVLDTQRADRLGSYGYDKPISPNLDRFAAQSILFEQAVAPAQWTVPSHASMFSGLYPSAHQVLQSSQRLSPGHPHIAEFLSSAGYETVGFCNNPLVGILNNGLKRGFKHFYNYGGAVPSTPRSSSKWPQPLNILAEYYTQGLRKISYPIQNFFGKSDLAFQISLNAFLTPLWSKMANFKGQNERSVKDVVDFLQIRDQRGAQQPLFLFLNLMETHLPFWPPGKFVDDVMPYFRENKEARTIMRTWNKEAYRWAAPLAEPLGELEYKVLNDMYDAEVAYQDSYLGSLLDTIQNRTRKNNTLTIIVADHGDGIGDHGYMGHAFVAYEELVHVPLIINWPGVWLNPSQIAAPVSTRRVFHTIMDAAGHWPQEIESNILKESRKLSLRNSVMDRDPENKTALSEVYPPLNFVRAIEKRQPELLREFRCLDERFAIVRQDKDSIFKLIQLDSRPHELFDLRADSQELNNIIKKELKLSELLNNELNLLEGDMRKWQLANKGDELDFESDTHLMQRLKGLGYLD